MLRLLTISPGTLDVSPAALERLTPEQLAAWREHDADTCVDDDLGVVLQLYFVPDTDEFCPCDGVCRCGVTSRRA